MDNIRVGDRFEAIIRPSEYSKTLGGRECAGQSLGIFVATAINHRGATVRAGNRIFNEDYFTCRKVKKCKFKKEPEK